jgi:hypothetical protein
MISQERKARLSRHAAVEEAVQANPVEIQEEDEIDVKCVCLVNL